MVVVEGVAGVVEIVTMEAVVTSVGPVFEFPSTTEFWRRSTMSVPSDVHTTATVMEVEVDAEEGVKVQPVADPKFRKSLEVMPDTASLNVSE